MAKLIRNAYTNYFGEEPVPVEILSYDNNKYARVRLASGDEDDIKTGYLFRDAQLTRRIPDVDWFIHGGGLRHRYKRRVSKTEYRVFCPDSPKKDPVYATKREALRAALALAARAGEPVEIGANRYATGYSSYNLITLTCWPTGLVEQQAQGKTNWLDGYGKAAPLPRQARKRTGRRGLVVMLEV